MTRRTREARRPLLGRDDPSADDALFRKCWRLRDVRGYLAARNEAVVSGWDRGDHPARARPGPADRAQAVTIPTRRAALRLTGTGTRRTTTTHRGDRRPRRSTI